MKAQNRKNPVTGRYAITQSKLSFLGRTYESPGLLDRLRGKEIDIYYDRRDISAIYLFLEGELVGEAYCTELLGQRMSIWEAQARRKADTEQAKEASKISLEHRQRIRAAKCHLADVLTPSKPGASKNNACWNTNVQRFTLLMSRQPCGSLPSSNPPLHHRLHDQQGFCHRPSLKMKHQRPRSFVYRSESAGTMMADAGSHSAFVTALPHQNLTRGLLTWQRSGYADGAPRGNWRE
jgi:hypothetical protein